jgi:hypothetical protein
MQKEFEDIPIECRNKEKLEMKRNTAIKRICKAMEGRMLE